MAFKNRVRLPFYLRQPQFPVDQTGFRLYDGTMKNTSAVVRKVYQAVTDQLPEGMHEKIVIALVHDHVTIEGSRYAGNVAKEGDYQINWQDFLDYPLGDANFAVQVTPFNYTNNNCGQCEDLQQVECVDDSLALILDPLASVTTDVTTNDNICCFPFTLTIVWLNDIYFENAYVITPGTVAFTVKASVPDGTNVKALTYRVTCEDGSYDEADVYVQGINGNIEACLPPTDLVYTHIDESEISVLSDEVSFTPAVGAMSYQWQLFACSNLGTPINDGTTADSPITFLGLDPATCYVVAIRTVCDEEGGSYSEWASVEFTTPGGMGALCGRFSVAGFDSSKTPGFPLFYTYMNCLGEIQNGMVPNFSNKFDCFLVDSSNNPISFSGTSATTYTYVEPC